MVQPLSFQCAPLPSFPPINWRSCEHNTDIQKGINWRPQVVWGGGGVGPADVPDPSLNTMKQVIEEESNIDVVIKHLNMNQLWKVGREGYSYT